MARSGGDSGGEKRWAAALLRMLAATEGRIDAARYRSRRDGNRRLVVLPYRGYGNGERLWVKGRVLREPKLRPSELDDPLWRNLLATWRRFASDEVPGARVRLSGAGVTVELEADDEGYFETWLEPAQPIAHGPVNVDVELLEPRTREPARACIEVMLPPPSARLAVISDVDDTVVPTGSAQLLRLARNMVVHNAHSRVPFPGVAAFYRALAAGRGAEGNPFLYLSSGPWNAYDLLVDAFRLHGIPAGALVLRDWGLGPQQTLPTRHRDHKLVAIRRAMELWPHLPFLLVGDSGQHDPEIYGEVAAEQASRVLAVYIRDVGRKPERPAVTHIAERVAKAGGTLLVAPTAWELASHAAAQRWIAADTLSAVAAALGRDTAALPPTRLEGAASAAS